MTKGKSDELDKAIGAQLRHIRISRDLSLNDLGKPIGVTYQQIQKYEMGMNRISASRLYQLSKILGVPIADFFGGAGDGTREMYTVEIPKRYVELIMMLTSIDDPILENALYVLLQRCSKE